MEYPGSENGSGLRGASAGDILGKLLGEGVWLALAGIAAGVLGALLLSRLLSALLYGISHLDPATYLVTATLVVLVSLLAAFIPARRATRVNPVDALRYE